MVTVPDFLYTGTMLSFPVRVRAALLFSLLLALLMACGGRTLTKKMARNQIAGFQGGTLDQEDVDIDSVNQTGGSAIAEARVRAAFKLEKVNETWVVREIRIGKRPWEKIEDILRALDQIKTQDTRKLLDQVMAAVERYREKAGNLPNFTDYISLSDLLSPNFLNPLIREDSWQRPLAAYKSGPNGIRLVSLGADGLPGTADDIELTRTFTR